MSVIQNVSPQVYYIIRFVSLSIVFVQKIVQIVSPKIVAFDVCLVIQNVLTMVHIGYIINIKGGVINGIP